MSKIKYLWRRMLNRMAKMRANYAMYRSTGMPRRQAVSHAALGGCLLMQTTLTARKIVDGVYTDERRVVKNKVVTDAFVEFVVDQLQAETSEFGDFKYHDSGTGTGAEAAGDTALGTPCGESRDAGTQEEGATANIYKSVATHTYAGTFAITEHGLFSQASGGTLMDRTKFSAINVVSGNQIEFTFQITFTSGG